MNIVSPAGVYVRFLSMHSRALAIKRTLGNARPEVLRFFIPARAQGTTFQLHKLGRVHARVMHSQGCGSLSAARHREAHGADWHENLAAAGKKHVPGEGGLCPDEGDRRD